MGHYRANIGPIWPIIEGPIPPIIILVRLSPNYVPAKFEKNPGKTVASIAFTMLRDPAQATTIPRSLKGCGV